MAALSVWGGGAACGRTGVPTFRPEADGGRETTLCETPRCSCEKMGPSACDDGDPCTEDSCDGDGGCQHTRVAMDSDHDGHDAKRPGTASGEPGSCGDDCDDTNPEVFPGHPEVCDGVDNDCDGITDEGFV